MVWALLVVMQLKHFIADYPLQTEWMLGKFKLFGWEKHLAAHCAVHLVFTFIIAMCFGADAELAMKLGLLDFTIHFIMDRIKASPIMLGRFKPFTKEQYEEHLSQVKMCQDAIDKIPDNGGGFSPQRAFLRNTMNQEVETWYHKKQSNKWFWYSLGIDQMVHHLTDLFIVYILVSLV